MKLNLFFIVMDLLTLFVFPFVFLHSVLLRFIKIAGSIIQINLLTPVLPTPGK